jgi:hypothetical protein
LILEIFLYLLFEGGDPMLDVASVLRHESQPGQQDEKCPTGP